MKKEIKFTIELDENNIPDKMEWNASDKESDSEEIKALMLSIWDPKENLCKRIDLWTKNMYVEEMKMLYFQTIMTMADGLERATGEVEAASEMRKFGNTLAKKLNIPLK